MKAQVKNFNGTPTVFLDDRPTFFGCHLLGGMTQDDLTFTDPVIREYAKAGIHIYSIDSTGVEWCGPRPGNPSPYDFSQVVPRLQKIIDADPQALFLFRMQYETYSLPDNWWNKLYPDEMEVLSDGKKIGQSFASTVWRGQVNEFLRAYIEFLRSVDLYDRVIAYQIGTGVTSEWIKSWSSMENACGDYSQPMRLHFRTWLRQKYQEDILALQSAWNDPKITFDTAEVPSAEEQFKTRHLLFRDPRLEQNVIDYYACYAELCADDLLDFCHTVKEATHNEKLTGAFFGYLMELAWNDNFFNPYGLADQANVSTIQRSGHLGFKKTLHSPDIDFYVSPYSYGFRGLGGDGLAMQPSESLRAHGKIYFMEEDTLMHNNFDAAGRMQTIDHSISVYQRLFAEAITHGQGVTWWESNYFYEKPSLIPDRRHWIERFRRIADWSITLDQTPRPEVGVFLDDDSYLYETIYNTIDLSAIWQQRLVNLNRFGAPHGVYLLDDLLEGKLAEFKLYIFLNAYQLNDQKRAALKNILRRDGKVALWLYASGYINPDQARLGIDPNTNQPAVSTLSSEHMTDLTGFTFGRGDNPWAPFMHITQFDHPITRGIAQDLFWNTSGTLGPVFYLEDPQATILGDVVFSLGRCRPGLGLKTFNAADARQAWSSVYCATPNIPAPVLRGIARFAGVNLFNEEGDVLYATSNLLSVHTVSGGQRTFHLPAPAEVVFELFEGQEVARNASEFTVQLQPASTVLYYFGDASQLHSF